MTDRMEWKPIKALVPFIPGMHFGTTYKIQGIFLRLGNAHDKRLRPLDWQVADSRCLSRIQGHVTDRKPICSKLVAILFTTIHDQTANIIMM